MASVNLLDDFGVCNSCKKNVGNNFLSSMKTMFHQHNCKSTAKLQGHTGGGSDMLTTWS